MNELNRKALIAGAVAALAVEAGIWLGPQAFRLLLRHPSAVKKFCTTRRTIELVALGVPPSGGRAGKQYSGTAKIPPDRLKAGLRTAVHRVRARGLQTLGPLTRAR